MVPPTPGPSTPAEHLTGDELAARGAEVLRMIADYWEGLRGEQGPPVLAQCAPGTTLQGLAPRPPEQGEPWAKVMADTARVIMPNLTHWQSPSFFAYFPANTSGPSVLGDLLSSGLGVQGMLWATSPAATELETRMLDWMAEALALPDAFRSTSATGGGVIEGTASEATLVALCAARKRAGGSRGGELVVYASTQAHSSVLKAAMIAGLIDDATVREGAASGAGVVRLVPVDEHQRMDVGELERAMAADRAAGRRPCLVVATMGTTGTGAMDDLLAIGAVAAAHGAWLHVDGAFAGAALICPELRGRLHAEGLERADSFAFNPHKWLLTGFDANLMYTRDRKTLTGALSVTPEYLRNAASEAGGVVDYRDWQIPLGRRFRALKLWFVVRHYGLEGLRGHIREHVRLGELAEQLLRSDSRFELPATKSPALVCFALRDSETARGNARTRGLMDRLNGGGRLYLTHAALPSGRVVLRLAIGGTFTREEHVRAAVQEIAAAAGAG
ncbi:MAG: pyridoxal-dependent decarboxylase [Phycisphaerales bacterium]